MDAQLATPGDGCYSRMAQLLFCADGHLATPHSRPVPEIRGTLADTCDSAKLSLSLQPTVLVENRTVLLRL